MLQHAYRRMHRVTVLSTVEKQETSILELGNVNALTFSSLKYLQPLAY